MKLLFSFTLLFLGSTGLASAPKTALTWEQCLAKMMSEGNSYHLLKLAALMTPETTHRINKDPSLKASVSKLLSPKSAATRTFETPRIKTASVNAYTVN